MNPPRVGATRVPRWLMGACGVAVLLCAAWAAWPAGVRPLPQPVPARAVAEAHAPTTVAALDLEAFRTPIWVAPAPPPPAEKPAPPPPPIKLQLLAILRAGEGYKAALYDPDADTVLIVGAGEQLGFGRAVEAITVDAVSLRDGRGIRTLALREDKP